MNKEKIKSNIIGLDIGLIFGKFFLNTEDLHFGYWPNGEKPTAQNFSWAQENHSDLIIKYIPENTKKILDVGSGSGNLARKLLNLGYEVDCVIPSQYLATEVKNKINGRGEVFVSTFEEIICKTRYDLIIFSESFQYVNIVKSLNIIANSINENGNLLICDFFRKDVPFKTPIGGGHSWKVFQNNISNTNLKEIHNIDITNETAPTIDFLDDFCQHVLKPISKMSGEYMISNYPTITKLILWKFNNRLNKINDRYLTGNVTGNTFKKFKTYRLLLYQNN